jgi:hypothetical protein
MAAVLALLFLTLLLPRAGCMDCPAGTFNAAPTTSPTACQPCPAGSAAPQTGSKACVSCTKNNLAASADKTACICPAGSCVNTTTATSPVNKRAKQNIGGRRLSGLEAGSAAAAAAAAAVKSKPKSEPRSSSDDGYKFPACLRCAAATENDQANMWPICCAATYVYNAVTMKCDATVCYDGATLVNGACVCADGAAWNAATLKCECGAVNVAW